MNDHDTPRRAPEYVLEQTHGEYQLRHRRSDTAIYINETAALLWELCDGGKSVGNIKQMLLEAYPDAAESISSDVDRAIATLLGHGALSTG